MAVTVSLRACGGGAFLAVTIQVDTLRTCMPASNRLRALAVAAASSRPPPPPRVGWWVLEGVSLPCVRVFSRYPARIVVGALAATAPRPGLALAITSAAYLSSFCCTCAGFSCMWTPRSGCLLRWSL
jgi:hypothetical protein